MTIVNFTPWAGLIGGLLIGASASLLLWLNGRIAGISGIVAGATVEPGGDRAWRWLFLAGLLGGAAEQAGQKQPAPGPVAAGLHRGAGDDAADAGDATVEPQQQRGAGADQQTADQAGPGGEVHDGHTGSSSSCAVWENPSGWFRGTLM